jgi:hypothetical protein
VLGRHVAREVAKRSRAARTDALANSISEPCNHATSRGKLTFCGLAQCALALDFVIPFCDPLGETVSFTPDFRVLAFVFAPSLRMAVATMEIATDPA